MTAYKRIVKPDFQSQVGLALASNKADHFEEAYNAYKVSLSMASDDGERSHVLAAMATIAYKFQVRIILKSFVFIFFIPRFSSLLKRLVLSGFKAAASNLKQGPIL